MEQYISKSALVAEIEKRKKSRAKQREDALNLQCYTLADDALTRIGELNYIQDFLDTLEAKEVNLEKEIDDYISSNFFGSQTMGFFANRTKEEPNDRDMALCAKHFFELGVSRQVNNINMEEVKVAAKAWSENDENTRGCDYIGAAVAERAFVACAEWLINKTKKGE